MYYFKKRNFRRRYDIGNYIAETTKDNGIIMTEVEQGVRLVSYKEYKEETEKTELEEMETRISYRTDDNRSPPVHWKQTVLV